MTPNSDELTRPMARKIAKRLASNGYYGISIVESFPEGDISVTSFNTCGMRRTVANLDDLWHLVQYEDVRA